MERWTLLLLLLLLLLLGTPVHAGTGAAAERYEPLFEADFRSEPGTVTEAYLKASHVATRAAAIAEWEKFLAEYMPEETDGFEDLTQLSLVRLGHYELARLYYLAGRVKDGDRLLQKAEKLVVYATPEERSAKKWCQARGFCK